MTCEFKFDVDDETAEAIIEDIEESLAGGEDMWSFEGSFEIDEAVEIRARLIDQLER